MAAALSKEPTESSATKHLALACVPDRSRSSYDKGQHRPTTAMANSTSDCRHSSDRNLRREMIDLPFTSGLTTTSKTVIIAAAAKKNQASTSPPRRMTILYPSHKTVRE
jgi:hypothetical protein